MKLRNLLFGRSGGYWMFWTGAIYLAIGLFCALYYKGVPTAAIQLVWLVFLVMPFAIPPLGRWLNMSIEWDQRMLNWFGKKDKSAENVVQFPGREPGASSAPPAPPRPADPPKEKEPDGKVFYRLGLADNNRVAFQMLYSEITMNKQGCQQMIDQLKFFQSQLTDEDDGGDDDPDGGEPVPVPEEETVVKGKKAA